MQDRSVNYRISSSNGIDRCKLRYIALVQWTNCNLGALLFHSMIPILNAYFLHHDKIKISSTALYFMESLLKAINPQICGHVCYMFQVTLGQVRNIKIITWCLQRYLHAMLSPCLKEFSNFILDCSDRELSSGRSAQSGNTAISVSCVMSEPFNSKLMNAHSWHPALQNSSPL